MSNILKNLRTWLQRGNNSAYAVFFLFAFILFLKTMIFHWSCFHCVLLSSLWKNPGEFFWFWMPKIVPVFLLSSFVFITHKHWWTIFILIFCDVWFIANLLYYKSNSLFLTFETMQMADNMSGLWDSLLPLIGWDTFVVVGLSFLYGIIVIVCGIWNVKIRKPLLFILVFVCSLVGICIVNHHLYKATFSVEVPMNKIEMQVHSKITPDKDQFSFYPFCYIYCVTQEVVDHDAYICIYVKDYSILSYLPSCFIYRIFSADGEIIELSEEQNTDIQRHFLIYPSKNNPSPQSNLIFILVESLESWTMEDICGHRYLSYLSELTNSEHVLFCENVKSQTKHGNSADGQMINVTGMLPISSGATCILYPDNLFPGYAQLYETSAIVNPWPGIWKQSKVTFSYGFKELIEPSKDEHWEDQSVVNEIKRVITNSDSSFCVLGITISSHTPFTRIKMNNKNGINTMPVILSAYLNCLNYTDSCIEDLMTCVLNSNLAANTTIVISGDHTIFRRKDAELDAFAKKSGFSFESGNTRTPLIIYSPLIEGNIHVTDECYQMDIFPTILHLIGCEDYYWHGFGVNLFDEQARNNRQISEQEAYRLSDLMIRSDYFRQYLNKRP